MLTAASLNMWTKTSPVLILLLWCNPLVLSWMASGKIKLWRLPVFKFSEIATHCIVFHKVTIALYFMNLGFLFKNHSLSQKHANVVQTVKCALWMQLLSWRSQWTRCAKNTALVWPFTYKLGCYILWALGWHGKSRMETCHVCLLFVFHFFFFLFRDFQGFYRVDFVFLPKTFGTDSGLRAVFFKLSNVKDPQIVVYLALDSIFEYLLFKNWGGFLQFLSVYMFYFYVVET